MSVRKEMKKPYKQVGRVQVFMTWPEIITVAFFLVIFIVGAALTL